MAIRLIKYVYFMSLCFINYYIAGLKLESGESRMSVILHT
jgi:hypothetical protein